MQQLIFVYNADSGWFNSLTDAVHKMVSPSTYQCSLCALTYGNISMKKEWREFIESLPFDVLFLYKDEFVKHYEKNALLPAIFIKENERLIQLISHEELNYFESLDDLKQAVLSKLKEYDQHHHPHL